MADNLFDDSILNKGAKNPAAPGGLQNVAEQAADAGAQQGMFKDSILGAYVNDPDVGLTGAAKSWYAGANMEGVTNSWDTGFQAEAFKQFNEQQTKAMEEKDATAFYSWFERDDATGVATWTDATRGIAVGDVYNGGKKVGNIYSDFDDRTANVMMSEFLLEKEVKQKIFNDPDRDRWLADEVDKVVKGNTELMTSAEAQKAFAGAVDEREGELREGWATEGVTGAGALGGAAIGAGAASIVPGLGTVAGAVGGAAVGGFSAWLNRDQLTEATARAIEVSSLANKKYGEFQGAMTGLQEFSGVGLRAINPISNLVQGGFDAHAGKGGDGESEFYSLDENGNRKAGKWVRGADLAGTLADSVLQFSNPIGIGLYMAGTTGHIVGNIGMLASTGDKWDDRTAGFHDIEGGKEWAAAIGSVGIDAVQIGFAGAIAKAGVAGRAAFGVEATTPTRLGQSIEAAKAKLMPWRNGDVETKTIQGMRFGLVDGVAVSARPTMTLMAPSELMRWVPTTWRARNRAALSQGVAGPDDYYRAALEMAGGSRLGAAIVNGWAEGAEEGIQAMLDPISVDASIDPHAVLEATLYGAAAGAGMSLGSVSAPPSSDAVQKYRAQVLHQSRNQGASLSDEQWAAMSPDQRKLAAIPDATETQMIKDALSSMQELQTINSARTSPIGTMARIDMRASAMARDTANANPSVNGTLVLSGFSGDRVYNADGRVDADLFAANHSVMALYQAMTELTNHHAGFAVIDADLTRRLAAATEPDVQAQLTQELTENTRTAEIATGIRKVLQGLYESYRSTTDRATAEALIDSFNEIVKGAAAGQLNDENGTPLQGFDVEAARRAVEITWTRHPNIDPGSFVLLLPQVSKALTDGNGNGQVQFHQSILKALGGDHDGDTAQPMNTTHIPAAQRELLRAGGQYLAPSTEEVEIGTDADGNPITESRSTVEVISDAPDGEAYFVELLAEGFAMSGLDARRLAADNAVDILTRELFTRYEQILDTGDLTRVLQTFRTELVDGNVDARSHLITSLFNLNTQALLDLGRTNGAPEVTWLQQRISLEWEAFQTDFAANSPELEYTPADVDRDLPKEQAYLKALAVREAVNAGQTLSILLQGANPVRESQKLHYSVFRAGVEALQGDMVSPQVQALVELYAQLGSNMGISEMDRIKGRNAIQKRVQYWLSDIADAARESLGQDRKASMMLLANMQVRDIEIVAPGEYVGSDGNVTLLQLLLKRSVEIEERTNAATIEQDDDLQRKVARLKKLSKKSIAEGSRSTTAQLAFAEVFASAQMHELLGDSSRYLGPQLSLSQVINGLANKTEETRRDQLWRWKRKAPYVMGVRHGNPPYSVQEVTSEEMSDYQVLVDTISAAVQVAPRSRQDRDKKTQASFEAGIVALQSMIETHRQTVGAGRKTDKAALLDQMLEQDATLATSISKLIPEAAKAGAFVELDGRVYAAKWVNEMLVAAPEQAAVIYRVQSWLSEWNAMGGNVDPDPTVPGTGRPKEAQKHPRLYSSIKSRFLQTLYHVSQQPDGFELDRLVVAMKSATSLPALMKQINAEPMWRGDRAELLAFFDDVAEFDADPSQVWTANLPGALQREAITNFTNKATILSKSMADQLTEQQTERTLISAMKEVRRGGANRNQADKYLALVDRAIRNRALLFPDGNGPRARDRIAAKVQSGFARMHDKGKSDADVAPFGEPLVTMDEFGVKQAVFQAADALTTFDVNDILTNPTKLSEGPARISLADGSTVLVDLSTVDGVLDALENPGTNELAKRVLFPTSRDVNEHDVVQSYRNTSGTGLKTMLEEADFSDLFVTPGARLSLRQAMKYIETVEAGVRKFALDQDDQTRDRLANPIQTMINEFLVAYTHGAFDRGAQNVEAVRTELYVEIATALQMAAALDAQSPALLEQAIETVKANLQAKTTRDNDALYSRLQSTTEKAIEDVMLVDAHANLFARRAEEITAQLAEDLDPAERVALQLKLEHLIAKVTERVNRLRSLSQTSTVQTTLNMYTMTGDHDADLERKTAILRVLGKQNRIGRFQGNYKLIRKINTTLAENAFAIDDDTKITPAEWEEAGIWAATVYLAELSGRSASSVTLTPLLLGAEAAVQHRHFDPTWGSLLDGFLTPEVLTVAKTVASQAMWNVTTRPADLAGVLESGLVSDKKLGKWTELVPAKNQQARQILSSASVGLAIPVGGDLPMEAAAYVGAGVQSYAMPDVDQATGRNYVLDPITQVVDWTGEDFLKLNNHFASRLALRATDPTGAQQEIDLMPMVGQAWLGEATVENSPYRVIDIARINGAIRDAIDEHGFLGHIELDVTFFDVDSKPFAPEWANNVYFEGVGADSETALTPGLVAGLVFAVDRVSKRSQQNPLDMATKGGAGYKPTPIPSLATATTFEDSLDVAQVLRTKALHLLNKEYDWGKPLPGDLNAFYKLMKHRHLVIGEVAGEKTVWWAEQAISTGLPLNDPAFPLANARLVPISESIAQTLLGKPGTKGIPGVELQPTLNLSDMDQFPSLDNARLKSLGLERLGETTELADAVGLTGLQPLQLIRWSGDPYHPSITGFEARIQRFRGEQMKMRMERGVSDRSGSVSFDMRRINEQNAAALDRMLGVEGLASLFARYNIPFTDMRNLNELALTENLHKKLQALQEVAPGSVIWQHVFGVSPSPSDGILTEVSLKGGYDATTGGQWPTYEDTVTIDLDSAVAAAGGDMQLAYKMALDAVKQYAKTGSRIVLAGSKGGTTLRGDLADHLREGSEGYGQMAESAHFFEPITVEGAANLTRRSLDSTLTAVRQFTGRSVILRAMSDRWGDASSENTMFYDLRPDQPVWESVGMTVVPTNLADRYGTPVKGTGQLDQRGMVTDKVLDLLRSPEGPALLRRLGGDPEGVPLYRRNANGFEEPGIRGIDAAIRRLQDVLESGHWPLEVGQELMLGDLIPVLGTDGSILFTRVGFQLPDVHQLQAQLATPVDPSDPANNPGKFAIAVNELQESWTVRPPSIIEQVNPDPLGGTSVLVKWDLSRYGKGVTEGDGWKTIYSPMPNNLAGPAEAMGANGIRLNAYGSRKAMESKQAVEGQVNNFGWAFALSGIDFRPDMVEFFLGAKVRDADQLAADWATVETFLTQLGNTNLGYTERMVADLLNDPNPMAELSFQLNAIGQEVFGENFVVPTTTDPFQKMTANQRLGHVVIASLLAPRVKVEHIISTSGLLNIGDLTSGAQITLMPPLFTEALNDFGHPELRKMLFDRVNAHLPVRPDGSRPYKLMPNFDFNVEMTNPITGKTERVDTMLQMSLEYAADENAVNYVQSAVRSSREDVSQHVAFTGFETIGARTATERDGRAVQQLFSDKGIERFTDKSDGGFWQLLRAVPAIDATYKPWSREMPLQRLYSLDAGRKVVSYLEAIDQSEWTEGERTTYAQLQTNILDKLGINKEGYRAEVDYLVRQFFAMPGQRDDEPNGIGRVGAAQAAQAASMILENVSQNLIPTAGGVIPVPHETLMRTIKEAGVWAPKTSRKKKAPLAKGWDDWVTAIFGQVNETEELFDSTFRSDNDGFAHTYKGSSTDTMNMPTSLDTLIDLKLMDKTTNEFIASIDPDEQALLTSPVVFDTMRATLDAITGHTPLHRVESARDTPESELAKRIQKHVEWRAKKGLQKQERVSYRNYTERGVHYLNSSRDTHSFFHNMINLSVGMRLLNPALWVSAVVEVAVRNSIDGLTNLAQGTSTNKLGVGMAQLAEKTGLATMRTPEQIHQLQLLNESMGNDDRFLSVVYDELTYKNLVEVGRGKVGVGLEKFAKFSATATSDPTFGMLAKSVAARYNEAALDFIAATDNAIPFDAYLAEMKRNPMWLRDNYAAGSVSPHTVGMNRIAQVRSMKQTVAGKLIMGGIDAATSNPKFGWNAVGHLAKIPFLFTRFNANALTTMMGLGGFDQMAAMMLDKQESKFLGRMKAFVSGREYTPGEHDRLDMSDVIDSVDLIRPFAQGAITHGGLMAFGLMAGGLGLSGEDEETKRRRRLATYLGTPLYYDPRAVENDFLYADSLFLDWLPDWGSKWFEVTSDGEGGARAAAQPHWIVRQFLSPVMGMERFFTTGDARYIKWGFSDAFSVIPNSVTRLWQEASITGDALIAEAGKQEAIGSPSASGNVTQLLINTVGVYERALLENSFVNSVRNGFDKYNRNPWVIPATDPSTGVIQRDPLTGAPVASTALEQYRDDEGNIQVGYGDNRDDLDGRLHQYAENSFSASLLLSLFTGQLSTDSTYFRQNMAPAQVNVTLPDKPIDVAEATFLAALSGSGGLENLTAYEIERSLKFEIQSQGGWWDQAEISAQAAAILKAQPNKNLGGGMSLLDKGSAAVMAADAAGQLTYLDANGNEQLTFAGGDRVLTSLAAGAIKLGDPSLEGLNITVPMRKAIEEKWTEELVSDGVEMGLDLATAQSRARRLWYGNTFEDPSATGLRAVLWDDKIPWTGKVTYNQLNTTFMLGPDGKPWATPFGRGNLLQSLGIPLPHRAVQSMGGGLERDSRGKVVDTIYGINLGLHALERVENQETLKIPEETPKAFTTGVAPESGDFGTGGSGWKNYGSSGYKPYKRSGYSSGGGYTSNEYANFTRMYGLPEGESPYGNTTPFINTSNPILRRGDVRRERVWSERGRLNQWQ